MALNYVILGLIFLAGLILLILSVSNSAIMNNEKEVGEINSPASSTGNFFNPLGGLSRILLSILNFKNSRRATYFFVGILVIILGFVAIFFTGFLDEPIKFE